MRAIWASTDRTIRERFGIAAKHSPTGTRWTGNVTSAGFTLTELLVVIFIIVLLTITALPIVLGAVRDRKFSETARILQAALAGARHRAIVSGQIRGIRLIRDENDAWSVSTLIYVGVPDPYATGRVYISGYRVEPELKYNAAAVNPHWEFVDAGKDNQLNTIDDVPRVDAPLVAGGGFRSLQAFIRFAHSGRAYRILQVDNTLPASELVLDSSGPVPPQLTSTSGLGPVTYQLFGPPQPLGQVVPTRLPDGIVIDVREAPIQYAPPFSAAPEINVPRSFGIPHAYPRNPTFAGGDSMLGSSDDLPAATWPPMDILFAPSGHVIGDASTESLIHFWVGERADRGPDPVQSRGPDGTVGTTDDVGPLRPHFLLTLNIRTGAVQVYQNPSTASAAVWPPPVGAARNFYADIYAPARQSFGESVIDVP